MVEADKSTAGPKVMCMQCGDIIQSMHRHDFRRCKCESIAADGGSDYLKMSVKDGGGWQLMEQEAVCPSCWCTIDKDGVCACDPEEEYESEGNESR